MFFPPAVTTISPSSVLAMDGDADRGARVLTVKGAVCLTCHQAAGQGRAFGPALGGLAKKRSKAELLESILNPSALVEPAYAGYTLEARSGAASVGLLIERSADAVKVRDLNLAEVTVSNEELKALTALPVSLMPAGLAAAFTEQELADLLAFLQTLE